MLPETLRSLFLFADNYSVTVYAVLAAIWLVALGCYIGEKVMARRRATISSSQYGKPGTLSVNVERIDKNLVAEAQARL